jgi:hypothetical protein
MQQGKTTAYAVNREMTEMEARMLTARDPCKTLLGFQKPYGIKSTCDCGILRFTEQDFPVKIQAKSKRWFACCSPSEEQGSPIVEYC